MSNLILLIIGLAFLILIMECPRYGRAAENKETDTSQEKNVENLQEKTEKDPNSNVTRDGKQFWSILPR